MGYCYIAPGRICEACLLKPREDCQLDTFGAKVGRLQTSPELVPASTRDRRQRDTAFHHCPDCKTPRLSVVKANRCARNTLSYKSDEMPDSLSGSKIWS